MAKKKRRLWFDDIKAGIPGRLKLSVPYNHKPQLLDAVEEVAKRVGWIYLPLHPTAAMSARQFKGAETMKGYTAELNRVAKRLEPLGIGMNLVANAPYWAVKPEKVAATAKGLRRRISNLRVTFADLVAAKQVHKLAEWLQIGVSCLAGVERPVQAMWWREQAGATHLTVSREINRRPEAIGALKDCGMTLGVVAFDDCVPGCQARLRHFKPQNRFVPECDPDCAVVRRQRPWLLAQKEILPGQLNRLPPEVCEVKISGRDVDTAEVVRRLGLYLEARSMNHPNGYYTEPASAWEHLAACQRNCHACDWCRDHVKPLEILMERLPQARDVEQTEWSATFKTKTGARLRLWIEPARRDRIPPRVVEDRGIYYGIMGDVQPALAEALIRMVAEQMEAWKGRFNPVKLQSFLEDTKLPGGLQLIEEEADG